MLEWTPTPRVGAVQKIGVEVAVSAIAKIGETATFKVTLATGKEKQVSAAATTEEVNDKIGRVYGLVTFDEPGTYYVDFTIPISPEVYTPRVVVSDVFE